MTSPQPGAPAPRPLFSADLFSDSLPRFSPVAPEASARVEEVLRGGFRHLSIVPAKVLKAGGMEINSNNFKIEGGGKSYLLKRLECAEPGKPRNQLRLLQWLRERGHPVPRLEKTVSGDLLLADGAQAWCLFEFVDGDFFSGETSQLEDTARRLGGLQKDLRGLPSELRPSRRWGYLTELESEVLAEMQAKRELWPRLFGSAHAALLSSSWPNVARTAALLNSRRSDIEAAPWVAAHCDLHPHNLLMRGDALAAIVDFESFVLLPDGVSLGYGAFKLLKQHAVRDRGGRWDGGAAASARRFFDVLAEADPAVAVDRARLGLFALAELHRRLFIVFKLTLKDGDTRWNHVLPMHLSAMEEIAVIWDIRAGGGVAGV